MAAGACRGKERRSIFFLREEAAFFAEQHKQNKVKVWRMHCSERPRRTLGFHRIPHDQTQPSCSPK